MPGEKLNKFQIMLPTLLAAMVAVGMILGVLITGVRVDWIRERPQTMQQDLLDEVIGYVKSKYVEEIPEEMIVEAAIRGIVEKLDPHSHYYDLGEVKSLTESRDGRYEGIGIQYGIVRDTVWVMEVLEGSPAEEAGMEIGDRIIEIDGSPVADEEGASIMDLLKGISGSEVEVTILKLSGQSMTTAIQRSEIPVKSVTAASLIDDRTAYIKVEKFTPDTYREFMEALEALYVDESDRKDLILDLRSNPGGYLDQALKILSQFFPQNGQLLVYTENRGERINDYKSTGRPFFTIDDVVVLINEGSASGSEIVAAAVQDLDRGIVIGDESFGKGLVQKPYNLSDGSVLVLTVEKYYTPSGRTIQRPYDLAINDSKFAVDSNAQDFKTEQGREVGSNGGVVPDYWVRTDSNMTTSCYRTLVQYVSPFVFYRWGLHPEVSPRLSSGRWNIRDADLQAFYSYADVDRQQLGAGCRDAIIQTMKYRFLHFRKGEEAMMQLFLEEDEAVNKAIDILKTDDPVAELIGN